LIELVNVSSAYGLTTALENVSLKIWPGQFMAIVGPNGGGKTTLLRTILRMLPVMSGNVFSRGRVAIAITAHDLNWVAAHLPWVVCLNRRIIAEGQPQKIFNASVLTETYSGEMVVFNHDGMVMIGERPHAPHN
jgi:ABC-type Mn2+/Zn2+ transport system ATPase subunit